jgi:tetratricopeptide (TPR) repeat protein
MGIIGLSHYRRQVDRAQILLGRGQQRVHECRYAEAIDAFEHGAVLIETLPLKGKLLQELREGARVAERAQAAEELHQSCEHIRALYGIDLLPAEQAAGIEALCAKLWQSRDRILEWLDHQPTPELEQQVRDDLRDIVIVWTDLQVRRAPPENAAQGHEDALQLLAQAQSVLGSNCVLDQERRAHLMALGLLERTRSQSEALPADTAWEHFALGRAYLRAGDPRAALVEIDRALESQPQALWPNFYKGKCAFQIKEFEEAATAFSVCVALTPRSAGCYYHRGLAFLEMGRLERAQADFDRALRLEPSLPAAVLAQGMVHYRAKHYPEALANFRRARVEGLDHSVVHYHEALIHLAQDDDIAAIASLKRALIIEPSHPQARMLLTRVEDHTQPSKP